MPKSVLLTLALMLFPFAGHAAEPMPPVRAIHAARNQVMKWMSAHEAERVAIASAYASKDAAWLEKEAARMARQPGFPKNQGDTPMPDEFGPFLKCDTAKRDLALLVAAMAQHAARGTPASERVVREAQADYDRNSATCKRRLDMAPGIAWAEYKAE